MDLATKKLSHEADIAALGSRLAWVTPRLATPVTYDDTKDLHPYWPRRAEPTADALARMDEISDWTCNGFVPVTYFTMPPWPRMRAG